MRRLFISLLDASDEMGGIAKLGHVALVTPSLEESVWFFRDVLGLQEVERADGTVYLRGLRDREHHTLTLTEGEAALDHVGWQTWDATDLDSFASRLEDEGVAVTRTDATEHRGHGAAVRFRLPAGHQFELYHEVEQPDPPADASSRLPNRSYKLSAGTPSLPQRIDHVQLRGGEPGINTGVIKDALGFRLIEYIVDEHDEHQSGWWTTNSLAHTLAYLGGGDPTFHHVAFHFDHLVDLWNAADVIREHGVPLDGGPGKHAITNANFMHVRDPGSGHRVELFGGTYQVFNPDWEPVKWTRDALEDQPWFGSVGSADTTPIR